MVIFKRPELGRIVKFIVFVSLFYSLESHSSDFSSTKLKELVSLRAEFNDLNRKLHSKQVEIDNDYQFLNGQLSALNLELRIEELKNKSLKEKYLEHKERLDSSNLKERQLREPLLKILAELEQYVSASLPFQLKRRLKVISSLKKDLLSGAKSNFLVLREALKFLKAERSLTEQIIIGRQEIKLGQKVFIADFIQLGMSQGYFKTEGGIYGFVAKKKGRYSYVDVNSAKEVESFKALFSSVSRGIDYGFFKLPVFISAEDLKRLEL